MKAEPATSTDQSLDAAPVEAEHPDPCLAALHVGRRLPQELVEEVPARAGSAATIVATVVESLGGSHGN